MILAEEKGVREQHQVRLQPVRLLLQQLGKMR
jgi:hypothetical protein